MTHASLAWSQRGLKRQPWRDLVRPGHDARNEVQWLPAGVSWGIELQERFGVGVAGPGEEGGRARLLDDLPGVHHHHVVGDVGDDARGRG